MGNWFIAAECYSFPRKSNKTITEEQTPIRKKGSFRRPQMKCNSRVAFHQFPIAKIQQYLLPASTKKVLFDKTPFFFDETSVSIDETSISNSRCCYHTSINQFAHRTNRHFARVCKPIIIYWHLRD